MKLWWRCLGLVMVLITSASASERPPEIRLASEVWEGYTHADGTGLAWDLLRTVFAPQVRLRIQSVPYTRSVGLVQRGEADAWLGAYRDEVEGGVFYPRWPYDYDQISALGLAEQPAPTLATLGEHRLVWMRGYQFQQYLPGITSFREIQRRGGILGMLNYRHADFYIDARSEIEEVLTGVPDTTRYRVHDLKRVPVYLGFADTPQGRALAAYFDERMAALVRRGELRAIFARWNQPYPFD